VAALIDQDYIGALRRLGSSAQYVTSVCTGSLLLAAAGLLRGRKAACHWAWRDLLTAFAVEPSADRIVRDGNVITGGGVTAGIDMALAVMADIAGVDYAQTVQLALEYAPEPPFDCGRPERARPQIVTAAQKRLVGIRVARDSAVKRAAELLMQR
jgi:transcriptional regulator GlxA family with amidase domain